MFCFLHPIIIVIFLALALTLCAVVQTPSGTLAFVVNVIVQRHGVRVCGYQPWTLITTKLYGFLVRHFHLWSLAHMMYSTQKTRVNLN